MAPTGHAASHGIGTWINGMVLTLFLANSAVDTFFGINLCLTVNHANGIFRAVHHTRAGHTSAAKITYYVLGFYTAGTGFRQPPSLFPVLPVCGFVHFQHKNLKV